MKQTFLTVFIFLIITISGCKDEILYDKEYLIFLKSKTWNDGETTLKYEVYKVDGDYKKFSSGQAGITANSITLDMKNTEKTVIQSFKEKYPNSRIYLDYKLCN